MLNKTPILLIYSRLISGFLILSLAVLKINDSPIVATILISFGLLSDIFDGIIALVGEYE